MRTAYITVISSAILYGSISAIAKPSLNTVNPVLLSSLIYMIIGIFLTIIVRISRNTIKINIHTFKLIFLDSICGAVIGPILFFYGLKLTNASKASLLINAEFLFSILLAIFLLKEKPGRRAYVGIILIFIGLLILNVKLDDIDFFQNNNNFIGNVFIIGATIFWALDNNISRIILHKEIPIIKIIQIKSLIGGVLSFGLVVIFNISLTINAFQIPNLLFLSLGGFAGSLFLFLKAMKQIGTVKSVMIFSTSSIFGIIFALIFLKENIISWNLMLSVFIMTPGIYLITRNS
ncbi:MAG: DMT family transporter [Candidatus Nitrosocosmicus sp.]